MQISRVEILTAAAQLGFTEPQVNALSSSDKIALHNAASQAKHAVAYEHAVNALIDQYNAQKLLAEAQMAALKVNTTGQVS